MVNLERMGHVMTERHWVAWVNRHEVWSVGAERDGILEVFGIGRTMEEAFEMAERSYNGGPDNSAVEQTS